jgi:serine/threonine protein kinase
MREKEVACKCSDSDSVSEELDILRKLDHNNIVKYCGTYHGPVGNEFTRRFFIVTDYEQNECMKVFLETRSVDVDVLLNMCTDIAKGMCYLSKKGFVHRDLSARNILITENLSARISGLGKCKRLEGNHFVDRTLSLLVLENVSSHPIKWMAPETIKNSEYSVKTDVWSFAITMYEIWCKGEDPWPSLNAQQAEDLIVRGAALQLPSKCPPRLQVLIFAMMDHESSKRPAFFHILMALNQIKKENFPDTAENWDALEEYDYK